MLSVFDMRPVFPGDPLYTTWEYSPKGRLCSGAPHQVTKDVFRFVALRGFLCPFLLSPSFPFLSVRSLLFLKAFPAHFCFFRFCFSQALPTPYASSPVDLLLFSLHLSTSSQRTWTDTSGIHATLEVKTDILKDTFSGLFKKRLFGFVCYFVFYWFTVLC